MKEELEGLIVKLITDFEKTIPEEDNERNEIIVAFRNYLYLAVKTIQESTSKFIGKDLESIKSVLSEIAKDFKNKDIDAIKRTLLIDSAFDEIRKKSSEIFEMAKSSLSGKGSTVDVDIASERENMQSLFKRVKGYNQKQAQELISEAIVDLEYITHSNDDNLSLRLYQFKRRINSRKEER